MGKLEDFRTSKDALFTSEDSPLSGSERPRFTGLKYFPENPALALELELDRTAPGDPITLDTSTSEQREFRRAGKLKFAVEGHEAELTLFVDSNGYFLPFRDSTSGLESYGSGRYLEPRDLQNGMLQVDFNYAYNPYCAYSEHFSCPLPPRENWLTVPIRAGEKNYH